ncbi:DUF5723 family protein [Mucilaginibacter sp. BT774]|uniref:DUF5723 family protein n=1 Tax=Mucilaginibacter sp. BT774 TaxID=3062276 RepID=UPI002674D49E|nr:DUF5723 family protein [Mucilaginibacter sp. BT774]MDO3628923.1 DUF5723 family protein [Mucilaginibacter sp. BT774]
MKKILLISCFLLIAATGFSQQYSLYNTGTLFDSFENPSQRSFIPDTSKKYAFNFLVPNFDGNFFLTGNAQSTLLSRAFSSKYDNSSLQIGSGALNRVNANASAYTLMFKMFASLNGYEELGFFFETKSEGRGVFTDESIGLFNGPSTFPDNIYDNVLNNHFYNQIYHDLGFTYREKISNQVAVGFKVGLLMGIDYTKLDIYESHLSFDRLNDAATISLRGKYSYSKGPGAFDKQSFYPTSRSPGLQFSAGLSYTTDDNITFQGNLKDLGFIHWYSNSVVSNFDNTTTITGLSSAKREKNIYGAVYDLFTSGSQTTSFNSSTNGRAELSATKSYYLNDDNTLKYLPTLIVAKDLFYDGFAGAMVNHFQYKAFNGSLMASYDNLNLFNIGLQLMYKPNNMEIFIGSDRLTRTLSFASSTSKTATYANSSFTGADFYLGFALKFGPVIEHPLNANTIPDGNKGFLARLWNRIFKAY